MCTSTGQHSQVKSLSLLWLLCARAQRAKVQTSRSLRICSEVLVCEEIKSWISARRECLSFSVLFGITGSGARVVFEEMNPYITFDLLLIQHFCVQSDKHLSTQQYWMKMWCHNNTHLADVGVVERSINLIQHKERSRFIAVRERRVSVRRRAADAFQTTERCSMCTCEWRKARPVPPQSSLLQTGCP